MRIEWQTKPAEVVLRYFVDGYGVPIQTFEWFYDASRQTIVFKLYIDDEKKPEDSQ